MRCGRSAARTTFRYPCCSATRSPPNGTWPRLRYVIATARIVAPLAALAIVTTYDHRVAAIFIVAAAIVFLVLRLIALLTMWIARRLPRQRSTSLRLAIANIHRPGALTPSVMLSLGLGLALLVTVVEIDGNLHREFAAALPDKAPSFFFLDIPAADAATLRRLRAATGARLDASSACRCCAAASWRQTASRRTISSRPRDRAGCCAATAASPMRLRVPAGSRIVAGQWWSADYSGEPLVSLESKTAHDLDLKIGDTITVNVLGRNVTARIANLRAVDWENLGINFVLVFSPGTFDGAPHTDIATLTFADGGTAAEETALIKALADALSRR